jgi:hypothetical protein
MYPWENQRPSEEIDAENDRDRMRRWRAKQKAQGLTQVRIWVPADRAAEVVALGVRLREGKAGEPSSPKQRYEAERRAKDRGIPPPETAVMEDRARLDVWLALHPRK